MRQKITPLGLIAILYITATLPGCVTALIPDPSVGSPITEEVYQADFDRVWAAVLTVFQKHDVEITQIDKASGVINGISPKRPPALSAIFEVKMRDKTQVLVSKVSDEKTKVVVRNSVEAMQHVKGYEQWTTRRSRDLEVERFVQGEIKKHLGF